MAEETTVEQVEQSEVLAPEEVEQVLSGEEETNVELPSDKEEFQVPEKFQGKSQEEIIKAYLELEKMKSNPTEEGKGGDQENLQEGEEPSPDKTEDTKENIDVSKYEEKYWSEGGLSDDDYAELEKAGFTKEQVEQEIEFREWKREKALKDVLEPLGGGMEKFKEVAQWIAQNRDPEEVKEINLALATTPKVAQQALLKTLYAEYDSANNGPIHTNNPQTTPTKGYANESEFFSDISKPEYTTDKNYAKAVEKKLEMSDTTGWSF